MTLTWDSIIDALGGTGAASAALDLSDSIVSGWRRRGIPAKRWARVVALAGKRGHKEITFEAMAALAADGHNSLAEPVEARA